MRIERIAEADTVEKGADLFDDSPLEAALATYRRAAANDEAPATVFSWQLSGAS